MFWLIGKRTITYIVGAKCRHALGMLRLDLHATLGLRTRYLRSGQVRNGLWGKRSGGGGGGGFVWGTNSNFLACSGAKRVDIVFFFQAVFILLQGDWIHEFRGRM